MTAAEPYYAEDGCTIYHGEALGTLRALPDGSVDGVITDPPYSSGGAFRGDRVAGTNDKYAQSQSHGRFADFSGDTRDQRGYAYWCALWLYECLRVARPGSPICVFTDWRQLPITTDALQSGGWVWRGIVPWDKTEGARPQLGRFTAQCEYVVWGSAGAMPLARGVGVLPGFIRQPVRQADKFHLAGKPTSLMCNIVKIVRPGGVVLDPFMGSGSTAEAARLEGYRFIGVEVDRHYCEIAVQRLSQLSMFGQVPA